LPCQGLLGLSQDEEAVQMHGLKRMILDMVVEEPLVILIKLADRLHNMRTVFALRPDKQRAVAMETKEIWCSMAEKMGWDALKVLTGCSWQGGVGCTQGAEWMFMAEKMGWDALKVLTGCSWQRCTQGTDWMFMAEKMHSRY
jgi:HD domain